MISNCGHDENGKYGGGKAGDQTGNEWVVIPWYNRPWKCVLRHTDPVVRKEIAKQARAAAENPLIGYDQGQRLTFWNHLAASNYDPAQITVACEADCSSGVAAIVKATGYKLGVKALQGVSTSAYTGNLRAALKAAGFTVLTDNKYLTSDKYLLAGDVLLYDGHHTAINLDNGAAAEVDPVDKSGWQQENGGWRYYIGGGRYVANDWYKDGPWYWFDGAGMMVHNVWYRYKDAWYYLGDDGAMCTGQVTVDGKWYIMDNAGRMIVDPVTLTPGQDGALRWPGMVE